LKKVLIIAYYFPSRVTVGSLRQRGLAKYLPEFGWEPIILTPAVPESSNININIKQIRTQYHDVIASWRKRLGLNPNRAITVQQQLGTTGSNNSSKIIDWLIKISKEFIAYPDEQKGWYPFAVKAAKEFLRKETVDALISSSSPVTSHLIAKHLKTKFNIPWIADFRDLWTQNHYYPYSLIRKILERRLELKTLSVANALVTVSKPWAEKLHHLHNGKPVWCIPNGFDPEEFIKSSAQLTRKFTITYTGTLYDGKRDPSLLFMALKELIVGGDIDPDDVEIRFYGHKAQWLENKISFYDLQDVAKHYGLISRKIALNKQRESQILLLLNWNTSSPGEAGTCPAKLFEYLAAQRPILAIGGPPGVVTEILKETEAGVYVSNVKDLKRLLLQYYLEYKEKGRVSYKGHNDKIMKYSQREMAKKFAQLLSIVSS